MPIDLAKIFRGFGPLPAVVGTRDQTGAWDHVGARRVVELADGSEVREELTAYEAPAHFAYRVSGFSGPLRRLVSHADGAWWFSEREGGVTHVRLDVCLSATHRLGVAGAGRDRSSLESLRGAGARARSQRG
ncbi:MAG TPA: hypothetical protein VGH24_03225 [Solirubrobacteraceae bacterium]